MKVQQLLEHLVTLDQELEVDIQSTADHEAPIEQIVHRIDTHTVILRDHIDEHLLKTEVELFNITRSK